MHPANGNNLRILEPTGYTLSQGARDSSRHIARRKKKQGFSWWDSPGETLLKSNQLKISQSRNAHVDRYELAFFLAIRHVGVGPNLQFAINRRILVDLESHRPLR